MLPLYKTLACLAVGAFALGVIALAAIETGQLHDQVLDQLERQLDEQFVGRIDAQRLTGTLLWGFTAHDVEIRDGRGEQVAHVDEFQVDASVFEFLDGKLRFDRARLVRPVVIVERDADGTVNVADVFRSRRPSSKARPPGKVLFEMTSAQVVDGQIVHFGLERALSARAIDAEGSLRVLSGKQVETVIDRLDAEIFPDASSHPHSKPYQVDVERARLDTNAGAFSSHASSLTVDDHWRLEDVYASRPRKYAADAHLVALRGRASSPDGGWLQVDARIDREDASYDLALAAESFQAADWPGAPDWSWLVLDGTGRISGRGSTREELDATVRWNADDVDVAGEKLEDLYLVARVADQQVDIETLDVTGAQFSASAQGRVSEGGRFALEVDTRTDGAFAKRFAALVGSGEGTLRDELRDVARLELSTKASGALDLSGRDALEVLERLDLDTTWKARDVILDDMRWGVAGGSLEIRVPSARRDKRGARRFTFEGSAALHNLHYAALEAEVLRTSLGGNGTYRADSGTGHINYTLEVESDGLKLGEHQAKRAHLAIRGAIGLAGKKAGSAIETAAIRGKLDLIEYRSDDLRAKRVATNIDVSGAFPLGEGLIVTHMAGLRTPKKRFRHAKMELRLLEGQKFRLKSKARVEISLIPDLPMYLDISGRHGRDLKALSVDHATVGRPGMRWKIREPGLVLFKDSAVTLKSLTLQRRSQRVRLDGTYGKGKKGSISAICSRLKSAQLRSFFDFSSIF